MPDFEQDLERIRTALASGDDTEPGLAEVAARYASACRDLNQRLCRCAELLKKGLRGEAVQQAQISPGVLDQFGLLDFPEREDWLRFAGERRLAVAPALLTMLAVELNHAFCEAETMNECLRRHRLLALARAPLERRVQVLWRLAKLDPLNPIWGKDLREFERARFQEIEHEIQQAEQRQNVEQVLKLYAEVTSADWTAPPPSSLVGRIKSVRERHVSAEARSRLTTVEQKLTEAVTAGDKAQARAIYDEAVHLRKDAALSSGSSILRRLDPALAWVEQQIQRETQQRDWQSACDGLRSALEGQRPPGELARRKEAVLALGLGIPEDLEAGCHRAARRQRLRQLLMWVGLVVLALSPVLVIGGPAVFWYFRKASQTQADEGKVDAPTKPEEKAPPKNAAEIAEAEALKAEVRSILRDNCFRCHNEKKKNKLRKILDHAFLTANVASDPDGKKYLVPGRIMESAIWLRVADDTMPDTEKKLSAVQKEKIKTWITKGAVPLE